MWKDTWEYLKEASRVGDGEYALIDNYRNQIDGIFHEQFFIVKNDGRNSYISPDFRAKSLGTGTDYKSASFELTKGEWNFDNVSIGVLNFLKVSGSYGTTNGLPDAGISISAWNPEFSYKSDNRIVHVEISVGCIEIGTLSYIINQIKSGDFSTPLVSVKISYEDVE